MFVVHLFHTQKNDLNVRGLKSIFMLLLSVKPSVELHPEELLIRILKKTEVKCTFCLNMILRFKCDDGKLCNLQTGIKKD